MTSDVKKPDLLTKGQWPFWRFLITGTLAYGIWYFFYEFYIKPSTAFDEWIIDLLVSGANGLLQALGFTMHAFADGVWRTHLAIEGSKGVTVGAPCDGIVLFALFTVFILAYPGPVRRKFWFIPFGLIVIHLLNTFRIAALTWIVYYNEAWLDFNHDYTFTIFVYAVVFGLWYWWVNKLSSRPTS